jgi:hypothetical protein
MTMTKAKMKKGVKETFGAVPWTQAGKFCLVHLDGADEEAQAKRAKAFRPEAFFDADCPHCAPFLKDGAFMVYADGELVGMRLLGGGMSETVILREPSPMMIQ